MTLGHGAALALERFRSLGFSAVLLVALLAANIILNPARFAPGSWGTLIGLASPLLCSALASTPVILSGRGGIDVSVGPQMGFVNAVLVTQLVGKLGWDNPAILIGAAILTGAFLGLCNGFFAAVVRVQPIVATLGAYLILTGLTVTLVPAPTGAIPPWLHALSGNASLLPAIMIVGIWAAFARLPAYGQLMAVGSDDRAAYSAGVNVTAVRLLAYVLTGIFAGLGGLSLTALIGSADPNVGPEYTLLAISSVALGGVSLAGGRGGLLEAAIGAADIFLLQSLLTYFNVSTFALRVAYGAILVAAVAYGPLREMRSNQSRRT